MTAFGTTAHFDIGRVISRLFGVLGRNFASFLLLAVLLVGLPTAVIGMVQVTFAAGLASQAMFSLTSFLIGFGAVLVSVAANSVLQGAIIHGTVNDLAGKPATLGDSLGAGLRFLLPLVGVGIVSGIGVGIGVLCLVVPGILLALAWSVAAPAAVMERTGVFGALSRSGDLTRNHRGAIFGLGVLYFVILIMVQMVVGGIIGGVGGVSMALASTRNYAAVMITQTLTTFVVQTATALVGSAGVASVYYELRSIKDGVGADQLAAVFD